MNKKLIRLTEQDLHNIVKESVNKILTELDWKTYANAAKKRYDNAYADNSGRATNQQELEKGNRLSQAANSAFEKQHRGTTINRASQPQQTGYYDPARNDYKNYMDGKSKYIQGQGWQ
jgi:DNA mismatch repair ATPase MutL